MKRLDDSHSIGPYLDFMTDVMETSLPLLDPESGLACWVIGDVNGMNLAEEVWTKVTSKVAVRINGEMAGYRLLGIVEDEMRTQRRSQGYGIPNQTNLVKRPPRIGY